jgi:hypothetical protein
VSNTYQLQLTLGTTSIDFIEDPGSVYYLLDNTFSAPPPPPVHVKSRTMMQGGEKLLRKTYGNRTVSFSFQVRGSTVNANIQAVNDIYSLIEKGSSAKISGGGIYSLGTDHAGGAEVGEEGLLLRVALQTTVSEDRITFRVVSGSVEVEDVYSVYGPEFDDGNNVLEKVNITLECEPYALGAERDLTAQGYTIYGPKADSSLYNPAQKMFVKISGSEIVGDAPAPIKFMETPGSGSAYDGIMLARESGNGLLSCPGAPVFSGSGLDDFWPYGGKDTASIKEYVVKIDEAGSPDTFTWSDDGEGGWVAAGVPITSSAIQLGANDVYAVFKAATGHTVGDKWSFKNDQAYNVINTNNAAPSIPPPNGGLVGTFKVNIPYGHTGRYRVVYSINDSAGVSSTEYSIKVAYNLPGVAAFTGARTPWVLGESTGVVNAGVVDFTYSGNPVSRYPDGHTTVYVNLYARRVDPSDASALNVEYAILFPIEAQDSYIMYSLDTSVNVTGDFNITMCGYGSVPVIGFRETAEHGKNMFMSLSGEYIGSPPTLVPGVDQELYIIPTFGSGLAWAAPVESVIDALVLKYRPKYLVVG